MLTLLINSAYKPSRVLRELQLDQEGRWQGHGETLKAKWVYGALKMYFCKSEEEKNTVVLVKGWLNRLLEQVCYLSLFIIININSLFSVFWPVFVLYRYKGKSYRATVEIVRTADQVADFCRKTCIKLECCPNLFGPRMVLERCSENCSVLTKTKYSEPLFSVLSISVLIGVT